MAEHDPFLNPLCLRSALDVYPAQRLILEALLQQLGKFRGRVLDIGCGRMPYKNLIMSPPSNAAHYIGLDLPHNLHGVPDLEWDGVTIPLTDETVHCAIATEVFEHCQNPEAVMREAARVLIPDGFIFFTVPFFWPLHCVPHDEYRFTPFALERHLRAAGFCKIQMQALGGWDASLAQMIGLWVRRRPMGSYMRRFLSILAQPIVKCLFKNDKPPTVFSEQSMMPMISGLAIKCQQ